MKIANVSQRKGRLGDGAFPGVAVFDAHDLVALRGVFAEENFRAVAVVAVEAMRAAEEPDGIRVAVFIHDVGLQLAQLRPREIKTLVRRRRVESPDALP